MTLEELYSSNIDYYMYILHTNTDTHNGHLNFPGKFQSFSLRSHNDVRRQAYS